MFTVEKLRLNKFVYVSMPTRRQMYNNLVQTGQLRKLEYVSSDEPYNDTPDNFLDGKDKVGLYGEAASLIRQQTAVDNKSK